MAASPSSDSLCAMALEAIRLAADLPALEGVRVAHLGRKSGLMQALRQLGQLPPAQRRQQAQGLNAARRRVEQALDVRQAHLQAQALKQRLDNEVLDVTLPGRQRGYLGSLHPITQVRLRAESLLRDMGMQVVTGPEVEDEYHNFDALNIPDAHPARAMHDTFYLAHQRVLRTHTSSVQIRIMQGASPPFYVVAPGRVYRCDSDPTHSPMFHQLEGLYVDQVASFSHMRHFITVFLEALFDEVCPDKIRMRFRPSYFPFTEPSAEVDIHCLSCQGKGCRGCQYAGWLEVLGCGMVHPNVLSKVNVNAKKYGGFAFGLGLDRLAMLLFGMTDLRLFFENDVRFLSQCR